MKDSIYLKALEFTSQKQFQGVTFENLKNHVEDSNKNNFNAESLLTFFKFVLDTHYWSSSQIGTNPTSNVGIISQFYTSFKNIYNPGESDVTTFKSTFEKFTKEERYFLNSEGDKRLLEFYELREARINAKQAYNISWIAIGIALLALFISPLVDILWCYFFNLLCTP